MEKTQTKWQETKGTLKRNFKFKNFVEAVDFVNKIVPIAEKDNHHPDLYIHSYNQVEISLKTHDADAITDKDYNLADKISKLMD